MLVLNVDKNKHDLFFELEAFSPRWQITYRTVREAAHAAKVDDMYTDWLTTDQGKRYRELHSDIPDTLERVKREQEASASLPFTLHSPVRYFKDY